MFFFCTQGGGAEQREETVTIADTNTREKERNGEEYMACCGRTPPNSQKKCRRILLMRLSTKPSLLPEISDSTRQAAGACYVFFLLFIIELYWTSERNCVFDPVLGKIYCFRTLL